MFAILYNGDTSPDQPYLALWQHDFWGHDISLNGSHKSYRPITVAYFRFIRQYTLHAYQHNPDHFLINNSTMRERGTYPDYIHREKDLQPHHLHVANTIVHSINSVLVMCLTQCLFDHQPSYNHQLSFIAGLLFVAHPVHVEAVTGIVGAAELLSCCFGLLSFFCYAQAHRACFQSTDLYKPMLYQPLTSNAFAAFLFWSMMSSLLYYLSALSKEGGVTVSALMILYSMFKLWQQLMEYYEHRKSLDNAATHSSLLWLCCNVCIHALLLLQPIVWLFLYLRLRQYLAGAVMAVGHDVFRRTENPVAFASEFTTRSLTIPYLHYYYLSLLIFPHPLSADYSFNCIPMIESLVDYRNIYWVLLYYVLFVCIVQSGFEILFSIFLVTDKDCRAYYKYWNILIALAWMIVPFMPASNLFFFVATFVAERLLYLPSIGFCILLAYTLLHAVAYFNHSDRSGLLLWCIVGVIVSLYGYQSYQRNFDWQNEETLFEAAYRVCPNSVKVLQNVAILDRRYSRFDESLEKLERAKQIDDTFCQADHWIGVTLVNQGKVMEGLAALKQSLDCKFAVADSVQSLQKLFQTLFQLSPNNPVITHEWASILYRLGQKGDEGGAYYYFQQALNQFITGSMGSLLSSRNIDVQTNKGMNSVFVNRTDIADRMEDTLTKLSERLDYHPIDCFHKLAQLIIDHSRITQHVASFDTNNKYETYFGVNDLVSNPKYKHKLRNKETRESKKQKHMQSLKERGKRKELYASQLSQSMEYLAKVAWKFATEEADCKQEMEDRDIKKWRHTWNYFALNIVDSILVTKDNMPEGLRSALNETDNQFWHELPKQVEWIRKEWNPNLRTLDFSQLPAEQRDLILQSTQNIVQRPRKRDGKTREKVWNKEECETEAYNRYNFLKAKLMDKAREEHFWVLVSLRPQIEDTVQVLKRVIEGNECDLQTKIWCLDGLAITLTPYVKQEKSEWNFDGLLENEGLIRRVQQTGKGADVQPMIDMIAAMYPYIQQKMQQLGVQQMMQNAHAKMESAATPISPNEDP